MDAFAKTVRTEPTNLSVKETRSAAKIRCSYSPKLRVSFILNCAAADDLGANSDIGPLALPEIAS